MIGAEEGHGDGPCVAVACIGNPDRGDDGVGAAVARKLAGRLPAGVTILQRSGDMLSLIDDCSGYDALIFVDAAAPNGFPGRIHRIDLASDELPRDIGPTSSHALGLADAIDLARALGLAPDLIVVFAIEGVCFDTGAPVTPELFAATDDLANRVAAEARRLRQICAEALLDA